MYFSFQKRNLLPPPMLSFLLLSFCARAPVLNYTPQWLRPERDKTHRSRSKSHRVYFLSHLLEALLKVFCNDQDISPGPDQKSPESNGMSRRLRPTCPLLCLWLCAEHVWTPAHDYVLCTCSLARPPLPTHTHTASPYKTLGVCLASREVGYWVLRLPPPSADATSLFLFS